jgi:hypothetical protein
MRERTPNVRSSVHESPLARLGKCQRSSAHDGSRSDGDEVKNTTANRLSISGSEIINGSCIMGMGIKISLKRSSAPQRGAERGT